MSSWLERVKSIIDGKDDEPEALSPDYERLYATLEQHKDDEYEGRGWYDDPDAPPKAVPLTPSTRGLGETFSRIHAGEPLGSWSGGDGYFSYTKTTTYETINEARKRIAEEHALEEDIVTNLKEAKKKLKKSEEDERFEALVDKTYAVIKANNLPQTRASIRADLKRRLKERQAR